MSPRSVHGTEGPALVVESVDAARGNPSKETLLAERHHATERANSCHETTWEVRPVVRCLIGPKFAPP